MEKINKKALLTGILLIICYHFIVNFGQIQMGFSYVLQVVSPIVIGLILAYLIEPIIKSMISKTKWKRKKVVALVFLIIVLIVVMSIITLLPALATSISNLISDAPAFKNQVIEVITKLSKNYSILNEFDIQSKIMEFLTDSNGKSLELLNAVLKGIVENSAGISKGSMNFFMGLIIAYYFLVQKDDFLKNSGKILSKIMKKEQYKKVTSLLSKSNRVFLSYLGGKVLDSSIIAFIAFIGMWIMKVPYAILFAILLGITNMIPYFGPVIGAIPVVIVTLFYSPMKAFMVAIYILILQQVDGLIIGPKILGDKVGVGPFWIIVSVLVGGNIMGVWGMLIAVPIAAVIIDLVSDYAELEEKIEKKNLAE
ncbi:MAG: AI-2E family transporter [Tissierellales bacterium]|jgi:predicted PurR-regulated permease PerM|nr:AI-2E family transporter [Tissierellales bacterium]